MSFTSASPSRLPDDNDIVHISTSSPAPVLSHAHYHFPSTQSVAASAGSLPPARSSSQQQYARASWRNGANADTTGTRRQNNSNHPSSTFHLQPQSPSFTAEQQLALDAVAARDPAEWESQTSASEQITGTSYAITEESFLDELRQDFSSPSTYPSFTNVPHLDPEAEEDPDIYQDDSGCADAQAELTQTSECIGRANDATLNALDSPTLQLHSGPSASTTQNTDFSLNETQQESPIFHDLIDDQGATQTASTSFSETMPGPTRRTSVHTLDAGPPPPLKRRRGSQTNHAIHTRQAELVKVAFEEDLFGDREILNTVPKAVTDVEELTTIDLTEATGVLDELKLPVVDNRVKISAFQCAICMDDVTGLTVTYCGHLFCAQCLHSSLDVESTKGKCPMCRAKIDMKPRESYTSKTKGFWPLELKLMTTTRKGKRKAGEISK